MSVTAPVSCCVLPTTTSGCTTVDDLATTPTAVATSTSRFGPWALHVCEGVFLSHADADHFNALPGVLRRFGVSSDRHATGYARRTRAGA